MCVLDGWERACIGTNGWLKDPPSRTRLTNCPPLPVKHVIPHSTSLSQFVDLVAFEIMFGCICSSYQLCVASKLLVLLPSSRGCHQLRMGRVLYNDSTYRLLIYFLKFKFSQVRHGSYSMNLINFFTWSNYRGGPCDIFYIIV